MIISKNPPNITQAGAGLALVSEWTAGTPERQEAAMEAVIAAWSRRSWPEGLLSYSLLLSADGAAILNYSQWTGEEAYHDFVRGRRAELIAEIDHLVPGIGRDGLTFYRVDRGRAFSDRSPGCVVIPAFAVDGPGMQRRLVDSLISRAPVPVAPHPELISSHFHLSVDGTKVMNFAQWTSAEAHEDFVNGKQSAVRRRMIESMTGVRLLGFKRYGIVRTLAGGDREEVNGRERPHDAR